MTTTRAEQREQTRLRIVGAAIEAFAEHGFDGSGTRDIAGRAGVTQGLVSYHFESKDELWRAAADQLFGELETALPGGWRDVGATDEAVREAVGAFVRLAAHRPQLFHFMIDAGRHDDDRMRWLVETHIRRLFADFERLADERFDGDRTAAAHLFYALAGGGSLLFAAAPECRVLTGIDPSHPDTVERHAEFLAHLFVP